MSSSKTKNLKSLSHKLSLGLRHKASELGWPMTPDGYVPVDQVLQHSLFRGYTLKDIETVVETNDKQRFHLCHRPRSTYDASSSEEVVDTILCIRANQGHSLPFIDADLLLQRLSAEDLLQRVPMMVHGTYWDAWQTIQASGCLSKMTRNHIHFAPGLPQDDGVISGMRRSCEVYIYIDIAKCVRDQVPIYQSTNGVLLSDGFGGSGILQMEYFSHVTDRAGNILLKNS
jgi:2'-phosphotransferase